MGWPHRIAGVSAMTNGPKYVYYGGFKGHKPRWLRKTSGHHNPALIKSERVPDYHYDERLVRTFQANDKRKRQA